MRNSEWLGMEVIEWRDPALACGLGYARFFAPDGAGSYNVHTSPERPAWYRIAPAGEGWEVLAFAYGADEPVLNLTDASALERLREDPREEALHEAIAVVAVLITGGGGPHPPGGSARPPRSRTRGRAAAPMAALGPAHPAQTAGVGSACGRGEHLSPWCPVTRRKGEDEMPDEMFVCEPIELKTQAARAGVAG